MSIYLIKELGASGKVVHTGDADFILNDPEIGEYFLGNHDDH